MIPLIHYLWCFITWKLVVATTVTIMSNEQRILNTEHLGYVWTVYIDCEFVSCGSLFTACQIIILKIPLPAQCTSNSSINNNLIKCIFSTFRSAILVGHFSFLLLLSSKHNQSPDDLLVSDTNGPLRWTPFDTVYVKLAIRPIIEYDQDKITLNHFFGVLNHANRWTLWSNLRKWSQIIISWLNYEIVILYALCVVLLLFVILFKPCDYPMWMNERFWQRKWYVRCNWKAHSLSLILFRTAFPSMAPLLPPQYYKKLKKVMLSSPGAFLFAGLFPAFRSNKKQKPKEISLKYFYHSGDFFIGSHFCWSKIQLILCP